MDADIHSCLSAKRWGGKPEQYYPIHAWFDESKGFFANYRHRALRHHTEGILQAIGLFGPVLKIGRRRVSVRLIAEAHVLEDLGCLPSVQDWLINLRSQRWMMRGADAREQVVVLNQQAREATCPRKR